MLVLWKLLLAKDGGVLLPYVIGGDVPSVGVVALAVGYLNTGPWNIKVRCAPMLRELYQ